MSTAIAPLLVELQSEELPPHALAALGQAFAERIAEGLARAGLRAATQESLQVYATPRRLGVRVPAVAARSAPRPIRHKLVPAAIGVGADGTPAAALRKKLDSLGLSWDPARVTTEGEGRQAILVYAGEQPGVTLAEALQGALAEAIRKLPIPKVMNYQLADGITTVQYVRPAHRLIALHGTEVVPVQALGLAAGRHTVGHRFHSSGTIAIDSADSYASQLRAPGRVIASFAERRAAIEQGLQQAAARRGARVVMPPALLDEVNALVEWPVVYESGFEAEFLAVPQECLVLTMQQNQKYFALTDTDGRLINRFLLVSNLDSSDPAAIVAGNARVVRARLADARFFFDQDRKRPLEARVGGLANVVYHNKLGSQLARVERLIGIAVGIARELGLDVNHAERAARLAKADLATDMVGEFPELQGVMGGYYARHDGEAEDVARAIEEHYRPRFAGDALPATAVGTCVALADKLETLVGLFGIGERPTGDRDPFALRRQALGVLRMLMEKPLALPLPRLLAITAGVFEGPAFGDPDGELARFLLDRLRGLLQEQGYSANEVESVVSLAPARIDRVPAMMAAVRAFMQLPEAASLAAANKRIGNLLRKSAGGTDGTPPALLDPGLLQAGAEQELADAYHRLAPRTGELHQAADYTGLLRALAPLKEPVDRYFEQVMVMAEDPALRANRLALLARLRVMMNQVADISLLAAG